ncbi:hypothetical protein DU002_12520 [Corallincola holothuriorum]|uniref:Uncharacterized protein n=1 Tax=Corallincola holothuriorum TaxID=2282215 RepID=A0A368NF19_9GAMM|nr:hypothetical protein [Corallincola holothuriorum]RCU49172.1 hypothetical protein DU002_12520 [Corallincola holothuriorum]
MPDRHNLQVDDSDQILELLRSFNAKVERLERSGFTERFGDKTPEVIAKFDQVHFENLGDGKFNLMGPMTAWVPDYNEDEIDAVVLTYRMLTQNNDRVCLRQLSKIYNAPWFPEGGTKQFNDAREEVNRYLDSAATVGIEDKYFSIRSIMDVIIYGGLAHSKLDKERVYNSWVNSGFMGLFQIEFVAALKFMIVMFTHFKNLNNATIKIVEEHIVEHYPE